MSKSPREKLIMAVKVGCLDSVRRLLIEGASPTKKKKGEKSALDWALMMPKLFPNSPDILFILDTCEMSYEQMKQMQEDASKPK